MGYPCYIVKEIWMKNTIVKTPCPDPDCEEGVILVWNIYNPDPSIPERQPCDVCKGAGFVVRDVREIN